MNIITLNYYLKNDRIFNIEIDGEETILDADIVIVDPSGFNDLWINDLTRYSDNSIKLHSPHSDRLMSIFELRKNEIESLLKNGKLIITFLKPLDTFAVQMEGGRNYNIFTSYDFIPLDQQIFITFLKPGISNIVNSIKLIDSSNPFAQFFNAFKDSINYEAYFDFDSSKEKGCFLVNKSNKPIGIIYKKLEGYIAFIPPFSRNVDANKLIGVITDIAKKIFFRSHLSPPPNWVINYKLIGEESLNYQIEELSLEISKIESKKVDLIEERNKLIRYKGLLYETGKELEILVIESFRLFGFSSNNRVINDLEHDLIFESSEGKGIAEIEGKYNDSIHIEKLDQLNRAVDEDFILTDIYPKGILIGNAYRFIDPKERKQPFTEKVLIVAKKKSFGLLTTTQIFDAVKYILENPTDEAFKTDCRMAILNSTSPEINLVK